MKTKDEIFELAKNFADHMQIAEGYQQQLAMDCFAIGYERAQQDLNKVIEKIKEDARLLELFRRN